jgi:hypothetical protein
MLTSKLWRGLALASLTGGLALVAAGPALAQPAAGPTITIAAKSEFHKVTGDVWVYFRVKGSSVKISQATLAGQISGATAGEVARLYARQFPYKKAPTPVAGQSLTLNPTGSTPVSYSFTAVPELATRYIVEVFASSAATSPLAVSPAATVYVVTTQFVYGGTSCNTPGNRPVCHQTWRIYTHLPASTYARESAKRWYVYFALRLAPVHEPPAPKWMYLDSAAKVSKAKGRSSTEFERVIKFSFRLGNDAWHYAWGFCAKDTEAKDGLNLPGRHGCGKKRVSSSVYYLG